jgi:hypothetical protein
MGLLRGASAIEIIWRCKASVHIQELVDFNKALKSDTEKQIHTLDTSFGQYQRAKLALGSPRSQGQFHKCPDENAHQENEQFQGSSFQLSVAQKYERYTYDIADGRIVGIPSAFSVVC